MEFFNLLPPDLPRTITMEDGLQLLVPGGYRISEEYHEHEYVHGNDSLLDKCEAAWTDDGDGPPMNFRLVGAPGVGKNAAVYALASKRQQSLYMILGNEEVTAEDLVVTATLKGQGTIEYIASPLLAAMLLGGICFIDEIAKMRPRALAPLASVLDERRSISSALIGRTFLAHKDFRFCAAYNPTDIDAFDMAPWLRRRTLPEFTVTPPNTRQLELIVNNQTGIDAPLYDEIKMNAKKTGT